MAMSSAPSSVVFACSNNNAPTSMLMASIMVGKSCSGTFRLQSEFSNLGLDSSQFFNSGQGLWRNAMLSHDFNCNDKHRKPHRFVCMAGDSYATLGVSRSANTKEIKSAYRRLARQQPQWPGAEPRGSMPGVVSGVKRPNEEGSAVECLEAATNRNQRKRIWNAEVHGSESPQDQLFKACIGSPSKLAGQVFDEMPIRALPPKRARFTSSTQDNCPPAQKLTLLAEGAPFEGQAGTCFPRNQDYSSKQIANAIAPFQVLIVLLSGKTLLQWVKPSDLVQDVKKRLEGKDGTPIAYQRLLFEGK